MALSAYERWKQKKEQEEKQQKATQPAATEVSPYQRWRQKKQAETQAEIAKQADSLLGGHNVMVSQHNKRYLTGNDKYRGDSAAYLDDVTARRETLRSQADALQGAQGLRYMDRDALFQLAQAVTGAKRSQNAIVKAAEQDHSFWSQFGGEEEYDEYYARQKDYEEKLNFDLTTGEEEVRRLKSALDETRSLRSQIANAQTSSGLLPMEDRVAGWNSRLDEIAAEYGSLDALQEQYTQRSQYLNQARHIQEGYNLTNDAQNAEDFYRLSMQDSSVSDVRYRYINDPEFRADYQALLRISDPNNPVGAYDNLYEAGLDLLNDSEKAIYNYYYAKEGADAANRYLTSIRETLNQRRATGIYEGLEDNTALELIFGVEAGLDQFKSGVGGLVQMITGESDYIPQSPIQMASGMVREDLADDGFKLPEFLGGASISQVGYDAITTTANMAPSILTSMAVGMLNPVAGEVTGAALMGASATGSAYQEMLNLGYDKDQSRAYAAMVGASEAGLQYLLGGISSMGGKLTNSAVSKLLSNVDNAIARTAIKLGGNMLSEGFEEGLQEVLTPWFQSLATGEDFKISSADVLYSSLLGALTAGFLEGGGTVSGEVNTYRTGQRLQGADISAKRLAELGQTFSADTVAHQLAGRVNENTGAYTMGRLFNEIGATLTEQNQSEITKSLVRKGIDSRSANTISKALADVVEGAALTEQQIRVLDANEHVAKTFRDVIINQNSTVNQRTNAYNEALMALANEKSGVSAAAKPAPAKAAPDTTRTEQSLFGQENKPAADTVDTQEENGAQGRYEASEDGKTYTKANPSQPVTIREVASIKDGKMTLRLEDGSTVDARDVEYASQDEALIYETVAQMGVNTSAANILVNAYHTAAGVDASIYAHGIQEAYRYGQLNIPMQEVANGPFSSMLTEHQRRTAYKLGQMFGGKQVAKEQATVSKKESVAEESSAVGKVHFDRKGRSFDEVREVSLKTMEQLAKVLGVEFHVFESYENEAGERVYKDANGNETAAPNGWYDPKDGSIHIDLNAGKDGKGTMLFTVAHELTHFIKQWSPAKFKVLANFLNQQYVEKGISVSALVDEQIAKAKRNGRDISHDEAYEEVVADSMEAMLTDGNVVQLMAELRQRDKTLWQKICDWFKDLVADLKALVNTYENLAPDSIEGRAVAGMQDVIVILESLYTDALADASANRAAAGAQKNATREGGARYSLKEYSNHQKKNWATSKRIVVYSGAEQLAQFIRESIANKTMDKKMYFGAIPSDLAAVIRTETGLDVENYNLSLGSYEIRKILKDHGSESKEAPRGQRAVVADDFAHIVDIVRSPTKVSLSEDRYMGKPAIVFTGDYNGRMNVVAVVSDKRLDLFVQTIYVNVKKEGNLATPMGEQAPINTPEANSGTVSSNHSIRESGPEVKEKFSLREPVEETKELVAVHNLSPAKFLKTLKLGGLPMPSIAITRAREGYNEFGEISLVFSKDTIDPEASSRNKVYSGDAWTPTYPGVEHKVSEKVRKKVQKRINDLVPRDIRMKLGRTQFDTDNLTNTLDSYGGDVVDAFGRDEGLKYAYLKDIGADVELPMKEEALDYWNEVSNEAVRYFAGKLVNGLQTLDMYQNMGSREMLTDKALTDAVADAYNWDVLRTMEPGTEEYRTYEQNPLFLAGELTFSDVNRLLSAARKYLSGGIRQTVDTQAARKLIRERVNQAEYEAWLQEVFGGIVEKEGIRNNVDYFTRSGNRRSFEALHYEHTLENVIRAMMEKGEKGIATFGGGSIFGAATTEYSAIEDIREAANGRMAQIPESEFEKIKNGFSDRFFELASSLPVNRGFSATDDAANMLIEAVSKYETKSGISNYLRREGKGWTNYSDYVVDDLIQLVREIRQMPVSYFEAKPRRAAGFDEVLAAVMPSSESMDDDALPQIRGELERLGVPVVEYTYGDNNERAKALNSVEGAKFSLRDPAERRINEVLQQENTQLKEDVSYLKELLKLQRSVTGGTKFTKSSVEAAAANLMKANGAKGEKRELAKLLNDFYEYIAKGEELTWESVMEQARGAADWIRAHTRTRAQIDSYAADILRELRGSRINLDEQQKQEAAYRFGSYNEFRKKLMGSITVAETGAVSLDTKWAELADRYPNLFNPDTTATDMPAALMDAIDTLRNMRPSGEYGIDEDMAQRDLLNQIYDSYWRVSTLRTVADVKQRQITKLKGEHSRRMEKLREFHREKTAQLKQEYRNDLKQVKLEYRIRAEKKQKEIIARYQESRKKGIESRSKTAMRHKIQNVVKELNQYLLRGTKERHVPIELQKAVAEALDAVNMDTVGAEQRIAKLKEELMKAKTPEAIQDISRKIDNVQAMGDRMKDRLQALKDAYDKFVNSDDPLIANAHDDVITAKLESVIENVGDTPLRDMTLAQLEDVYDMYRMVLTTIRNANKTFKQKKSESIAALGNRVMTEVRQVGGKKTYRLKGTEGLESFDWNNLKPVYAFERIGSGTLTEIFGNVRAGEDVWAKDVTEAREYYLARSKKYNYDTWDFGKRHKFTSTSGMDFELGLEQIMSLYAYSKREQAAEHLRRGGIVIDETTEVTMKSKLGVPLKFNPTEATAYNISIETLADIVSKLTGEQKAFVDEMQEYLSSTMGEKGNEVSLELYGIKLFKEKFYFPLKSAAQFMAKAKEQQQGEAKIKNSGFSKETVRKASNPVVLTPFMDVWANHVNEMSMYHAFVLPMEDFYRVYNFKTPTSETSATESVEMFIQNAYGKGATKYIDQLLKDLNGGARSDPRETFSKSLMSKFKKASVMASLSVVVQQPTSIIRAMALVDAKYFGPAPITRGIVRTANARKHKALWNEVKQYSPVAVIKEMGHFDTNMGRSTLDFIKAKEYKNLTEKAKGFFTDSGYRDEVISRPAALGDELAWVAIWDAVKKETMDKRSDLTVGSEAFLKAAGKRFTEVVTKTQVYDSVLARSGNMRSKTAFMNMWTSFMAEPTTSINILQDALLKAKRGNKRYAAKAIGAVYGSVILNAALVSLVYAMRDDDEDETFAEKYLARLTTEVIDGINPLTYIPFLKDVWSIMQGYDIERSDMSLITDLVDTLQKTVKVLATDTEGMDTEELAAHEKKVAEALWGMVDNISSLAGVPVKNVRRDINGIINLFGTLSKDIDGRQTTVGSLLDKIQADIHSSTPIIGWLPGEKKGDRLYDAVASGDEAYTERLKGSYSSESTYNTALGNAVKERVLDGEIDAGAAADFLEDHAGRTGTEAMADVQYWLFTVEHPEVSASASWFDKYYEDIVGSGVTLEMYIDYRDQVRELSKKAEKLPVIDALPITKAQKDALYFAEGWAESTLNEAPWHQ